MPPTPQPKAKLRECVFMKGPGGEVKVAKDEIKLFEDRGYKLVKGKDGKPKPCPPVSDPGPQPDPKDTPQEEAAPPADGGVAEDTPAADAKDKK